MERSVTLLPEPDSPSTASTCPARSSKLTALTARTTPSRVANSTLRSRTLRSDMREAVIVQDSTWGLSLRASVVPEGPEALIRSWAILADDVAQESGDPKRGASASGRQPCSTLAPPALGECGGGGRG